MMEMTALGAGQYMCSYTFTSIGVGEFSAEVFLENAQARPLQICCGVLIELIYAVASYLLGLLT